MKLGNPRNRKIGFQKITLQRKREDLMCLLVIHMGLEENGRQSTIRKKKKVTSKKT